MKDPLHDDIQSVLFEVEQAIENGVCPWQIESAFEAYEAARRLQLPAAPEQQEPEEEQAAFERWAERVCPSGDVTEVKRQWEASSDLAEWLASQRTEDVLIDGVAYTVPVEVACELLRLHMVAQAPNAQQAEPHGRPVSERAAELAADPVRGPRIEAMREKLAQQAEVQEPFAFAYEYIHGKTLLTLERQEDWADNEIQLFTRPQPAQLERLSEEETVTAWRGVKDVGDDKYNAILLSEAIQSALAAKNWAVLAAAAMAPEEAE